MRGQRNSNDPSNVTPAALVQNIVNGAGLNTQIAQYPIFFSDASPSGLSNTQVEKVLVALNIPLVPPSPTVSNVSFVGYLGGTKTTPGVGGTFTFSTTNTITYQIVIDHNAVSPTFDPANPNNAVLTGIAGGGTHTVNWDGKDNSGVNFPSSNTAYPFRVIGHNGDIHFPIIDSENNLGGGPTVIRLNGINSGSNTVYYDDRGYRTSSGNLVGNLNGTLEAV